MNILKSKYYYQIVTIVISLILFIVIGAIIFREETVNSIDYNVRNFMYDIRGEKGGATFWFFRIITECAFVFVIIMVCLILGIVTKFDRRVWFLGVALIVTYAGNELIKLIFLRERPIELLRWMEESSSSFPSGHSMIAITLYGLLIYYVKDSNTLQNKYRIMLYILFTTIILLVGLSRMILGVHYFTDVIGGYCCGLVFLNIAIIIYKAKFRKKFKKGPKEI